MTIQDSVGVYDSAEFAENPEARCPIVLVLDTSPCEVCQRPPIHTINRALPKFRDIIRGDSVTALRADIAILVCSQTEQVILDFTNGVNFEPPDIPPIYGKSYANSIHLALDMIEARKQSYRDGGIAYYRSLVYFLTDGHLRIFHPQSHPTTDKPEDWVNVSARLAEMERNRSVAFFSFAFSHETLPPRLETISVLAPPHRQPVLLTNMEQLDGSIQWLSRSVAAVSQSQPGESLRLPQQDFLNL